jgi:hypothetical protein
VFQNTPEPTNHQRNNAEQLFSAPTSPLTLVADETLINSDNDDTLTAQNMGIVQTPVAPPSKNLS